MNKPDRVAGTIDLERTPGLSCQGPPGGGSGGLSGGPTQPKLQLPPGIHRNGAGLLTPVLRDHLPQGFQRVDGRGFRLRGGADTRHGRRDADEEEQRNRDEQPRRSTPRPTR